VFETIGDAGSTPATSTIYLALSAGSGMVVLSSSPISSKYGLRHLSIVGKTSLLWHPGAVYSCSPKLPIS
jgi:hypothetical protein